MDKGAPDASDPGLQLGGGKREVAHSGGGLSMRARVRAIVIFGLLITVPALALGVARASRAGEDARVFLQVERVAEGGGRLQLEAEKVRAALWAYEAAPGIDAGRRLRGALDRLAHVLLDVEGLMKQLRTDASVVAELEGWRDDVSNEPLLGKDSPLSRMRAAAGRVRTSIDPQLKSLQAPDTQALRRAHTALDTLRKDAHAFGRQARALTRERAQQAESAVAFVGRDQIVLLLLLLFIAPVLIGAGPAWTIAPLLRLRAVAQRIKTGRARELAVAGADEVAVVARAIKGALSRLEAQDTKQRAKIFEMRRALRRAIAHVRDAVLIVGRGGRVDYANTAAATLLGREMHHIESAQIDEVLFAPGLIEAIDKARTGDVEDAGVDVTIETEDERVEQLHAMLDLVRNQEGQVTRVVVVLQK
jgi:PAS domain-containing protein